MRNTDKEKKSIYDKARYQKLREKAIKSKPADPIDLISNEDAAYIAGLIDADGSIYISAVGPHRTKTVYPVVVVAMTHKPVIEWLCETLKSRRDKNAGTVQLHNQTNLRKYSYMKPQYRFTLFGKRAQLLCKRILPYMKVKNEQAALVLEFPCDVRIAPGVTIEMTNVNDERLRLRNLVNGLNHVNGRDTDPEKKRRSFYREG